MFGARRDLKGQGLFGNRLVRPGSAAASVELPTKFHRG